MTLTRRRLLTYASAAAVRASDLQRTMDRAMSGRNGTALAMEVSTGRLLAHYRLPAAARLLARPGSTAKPFTLLAWLSSRTPRTLICGRTLRLGERQMDCTHPAAPKLMDSSTALAYSCNFYF